MRRRIEHVSAFEGYQRWAATYDDTPNPVVAMDERHTLPLLAPWAGESILDAGCGTGRSLPPLLAAGASPVGLNFSVEMLKVARRRLPSARLAAADLQRPLPLRSRRFDAALCALVGEHLANLSATFSEVHRVLRPWRTPCLLRLPPGHGRRRRRSELPGRRHGVPPGRRQVHNQRLPDACSRTRAFASRPSRSSAATLPWPLACPTAGNTSAVPCCWS